MPIIRLELSYLFSDSGVLAVEMVENSSVFFVNTLHFIDVLGDFFHPFQSLCTKGTFDIEGYVTVGSDFPSFSPK